MWEIEEVPSTMFGRAYLIKNMVTGGYLADNGPGGGAIHFGTEEDAETVRAALNEYRTR